MDGVYVDVLVLVNLTMNCVLLWAAGRLAAAAIRPLRLVLGALLGAAYSLLPLLTGNPLLAGLTAKLLASCLMILVAFGFAPWRAFLRALGCFYLAAFAAGGAVLAAGYLGGGPWATWQPSALALAAGAAVALVVARAVRDLARRHAFLGAFVVPVEVSCGGEVVRLRALLDTGNRLLDPFSGRPVLIAEYGAMRRLVPPGVRPLFECAGGAGDAAGGDGGAAGGPAADEGGVEAWARLRAIPYQTVGLERGVLLGFRPDAVVVVEGGLRIPVGPAVVALTMRSLAPDGAFQALLPPELASDVAARRAAPGAARRPAGQGSPSYPGED